MEAMVEQSTASRSIMCDTNIATVKKLVIKQNTDMGKQKQKSQNLRSKQLKQEGQNMQEKGIINRGDVEIQKKHDCGIKETRIMKVKSGTEKEEIIEQHLQHGKIETTEKYKFWESP